ncbi:MAG TPA: hypothetical protein VFL54_09980 [Gammaproteobacteria bacterium]|nr:hypothetical protein [Gammaproteobacteria bacterium]
MAKKRSEKESEPAAVETQATPDNSFPLTLDEFCQRLSARDKRVELIGAFHAREVKARHIKDTEANFRQRYEDFVRAPVK